MDALALLRSRRYDEAITACQHLLAANLDDIGALHILTSALLQRHRYDEVIRACEQLLAVNLDDIAAIGRLAMALRAKGENEAALPWYERVDEHERNDKIATGRPGRQMDISCLYWCMGNQPKAIRFMRGLVRGILDRTIEFGDLAGGVRQGLLLYYMGITANDPETVSFALKYLRNRAKRIAIDNWPGPLARYYLGEIDFADVVAAATKQLSVPDAIAVARDDVLSRHKLCGALFHDGVKSRARGAEEQCLARMRECHALEDPLIEPEWYLARYEVERAAGDAGRQARGEGGVPVARDS